jgi:hypothetical protein
MSPIRRRKVVCKDPPGLSTPFEFVAIEGCAQSHMLDRCDLIVDNVSYFVCASGFFEVMAGSKVSVTEAWSSVLGSAFASKCPRKASTDTAELILRAIS